MLKRKGDDSDADSYASEAASDNPNDVDYTLENTDSEASEVTEVEPEEEELECEEELEEEEEEELEEGDEEEQDEQAQKGQEGAENLPKEARSKKRIREECSQNGSATQASALEPSALGTQPPASKRSRAEVTVKAKRRLLGKPQTAKKPVAKVVKLTPTGQAIPKYEQPPPSPNKRPSPSKKPRAAASQVKTYNVDALLDEAEAKEGEAFSDDGLDDVDDDDEKILIMAAAAAERTAADKRAKTSSSTEAKPSTSAEAVEDDAEAGSSKEDKVSKILIRRNYMPVKGDFESKSEVLKKNPDNNFIDAEQQAATPTTYEKQTLSTKKGRKNASKFRTILIDLG